MDNKAIERRVNMIETLAPASQVDWARFAQAKASLGGNFTRLLGYFREDGGKSVAAIEAALRGHDAIGMIGPADLLKSEAVQMGALGLAELAESIEYEARDCVELHLLPDTLVEQVVSLREAYEAVLAQFDRETNPLMVRRAPRPLFSGQFGQMEAG
jgi:histidine phosphotransfer protein HptB